MTLSVITRKYKCSKLLSKIRNRQLDGANLLLDYRYGFDT